MKLFFKLTAFSAFAVASLCPPRVQAQSKVDFKGKTIRLIIGTSTGGGVDLYARLAGQFLGKHLLGEPLIVPQNMPGASSVVAANYIYKVAKPDGLTLSALQGEAFFDQILGHNTVKFDWVKFTWIGSPERLEAQLCVREMLILTCWLRRKFDVTTKSTKVTKGSDN